LINISNLVYYWRIR